MRILSWNIHSCRGLDGAVSVRRVAEEIEALAPDIIGLNEVRSTWLSNQPRRLARLLGMPTAFQRNLVAPGLRFGNAVMVRGEILGYEHVGLPDGREPRGLLLTRVRVRGEEMSFGVVHLGLSAAIRRAQRERVRGALPEGPLVLAGDFNDGPRSLGSFADRLSLVPSGATFPAGAPARPIDFVLHSSHWSVQNVEVPPTVASDHRPVVVDVVRQD